MAGTRGAGLRELVSPFLRGKMGEAEGTGRLALERQYLRDARETHIRPEEHRRHYEAELHLAFEGRPVAGVERLYRRTILIEPTTVCAAHCRWCLRGQYPIRTLDEEEITHATRYIGSAGLRDDVDEVLVTGGDPLMSLPLLALTLSELRRNAPNVRTVRIGTRVPFQDPGRVNADLLAMFHRYPDFAFEAGVNVNHPVEFWPESTDALRRLREAGFTIYNQHPLLKGVNDDLATLVELYDLLRHHQVEAHYLFHAIPLRGMSHHRTSLRRGLDLALRLASCGRFSGRAKPRLAVLSDIGKIVLYEGSILERRPEGNLVLLRSGFRPEERLAWNPSWSMPASAEADDEGCLRVWYLDAPDDGE